VRFILVNGRSPQRRSFCVMCDQPIATSYLREIGTDLTYCNHNCYVDHCRSATLLLENQARRFTAAASRSEALTRFGE
jgi:hypothetical protein